MSAVTRPMWLLDSQKSASYRNKIVNQEATFDELARSYSDCSSAKRGGDLGKFGRGKAYAF